MMRSEPRPAPKPHRVPAEDRPMYSSHEGQT